MIFLFILFILYLFTSNKYDEDFFNHRHQSDKNITNIVYHFMYV